MTKAVLSRQKYGCGDTYLSPQMFCQRNIILSRQKLCCDKHIFVATKDVFCRDKHMFVATSILLSRQKMLLVAAPANDSRDRHVFVATKLLSRRIFLAANITLSRPKFCYDKHTFVAKKDVFCRNKNTCLSRLKKYL